MDKIYLFLENFSSKKYYNFVMFIFSPIFLLLEFIIYKYYWKIILSELINNDNIIGFLDKNEFALQKGRLIKSDLFDDNDFYKDKSDDEVKFGIKGEYIEKLLALFNFVSFDLENYLSIFVTTEYKVTNIRGSYYPNKIYTVFIQFNRYYYLMKTLKYSIWNLSILFVSTIIFLLIIL